MSRHMVSFMGVATLYEANSLRDPEEGEKIPMCFVHKESDFVFLDGYYTRRNGTNCFVRVLRDADFTDSSGFIRFAQEKEEVFLPHEVIGWCTLSSIGIGKAK